MPCTWAEAGLGDWQGPVRCRRNFGYPGRIDAHERVWLTVAAVADRAEVSLNGTPLGRFAGGPWECEVTALLRPRNELAVVVDGPPGRAGLCGEVALEVRCTAFLRGVRLWRTGDDLHLAGEVVGSAPAPLDLYAVCDRSTVAYSTVEARPEGQPFHLVAPGVEAGQAGKVQVDLVSGATVWYTVGRAAEASQPPLGG
jgi:hypothetical protein